MAPKTLLAVLLLSTTIGAARAAPQAHYVIAGNTPQFISSAKRMSVVDGATVMDVTLWLKPQRRDELDALAAALYDRHAPAYRHWLKPAAFAARYAPGAAQTQQVRDFLTAHGMTIVAGDKAGFFVRARGTAAAMQAAFHVELANVSFRGTTLRTNMADPAIDDPAGALVAAIEGLDTTGMTHPLISQSAIRPMAGQHGQAAVASQAAPAQAASETFQSVCFGDTTTENFNTLGGTPSATYSGNLYKFGVKGCGYTPPQIQTAYGLDKLYSQGLDGTGQTIVIVDWCGSPTILRDANAYSKKYGLPALTSANFQIVNYPAPASCAAPDVEINIDVEWAHAIAPGAAITLLVPPTPSFADIDSSLLYAVEAGLGNVVSNSYGSEELYTDPTVLQTQNFILEAAAVTGISMNFSTGDDGDFTFDFPRFSPPSVSAPADSPYATAVGGVSLALDAANTIQWQAGWGTNITLLANTGFVPVPAENFRIDFGSGGGTSAVFPKPAYQAVLPGKGRKLPDVSWLGDPYTGGVIAISMPFVTPTVQYTVYGGTSLACPMFSALWAIADQAAQSSLGLASAMLYAAPASVYSDIVPVGSRTNVTGVGMPKPGKTITESADQLAAPLRKSGTYISAIWNYPLTQDTAYVLTFGTDSGLVTNPGWDDVTGLGVAKPPAFVRYFAAP